MDGIWDVITVGKGKTVNEELDNWEDYEIETPVYEGYEFLGWFRSTYDIDEKTGDIIDFNYGEAFSFDEVITSDMEVFAGWAKEGTSQTAPTAPSDTETEINAGNTTETAAAPKTSDDFNIGIVLIAMTIAAAAAVGTVAIRRKTN